jgi:hypothetical protein
MKPVFYPNVATERVDRYVIAKMILALEVGYFETRLQFLCAAYKATRTLLIPNGMSEDQFAHVDWKWLADHNRELHRENAR